MPRRRALPGVGAVRGMSEGTPETQWYIARDGQQHGPLTDSEMRAFIEMRHLRTTDLVWRPGFTDWRPAPSVFPLQAHGAMPGETQDRDLAPALIAAKNGASKTELSKPKAGQTERRLERNTDRQAVAAASGTSEDGAATSLGWGKPGSLMAALRRAQHGEGPIAASRVTSQAPAPVEKTPARRALLAASITGAVLVGGIAIAVYRGGMSSPGESAEQVSQSPPAGGMITAAVTPERPPAPTPSGPGVLDTEFQRLPVWSAVKKEFPDWYGQRLEEAAKLKAEQQPDLAISKHMAEALVALRRKHADQALSASTGRLRGIATAFLENLKALSQQSTSACYSFISQGETSPAIVEMLQKREDGRHIHEQVIAIVDAIAEGRTSPVAHQKPNKADYDALAGSLMRLGWSQADLQLFADPRALARSTPEKVCKMVQDWFVAHIAIKDEDAQERLLVETLRPVVSG